MELLFVLYLTLQLPTPPAPPPQPPVEIEEEIIVTATRTGRLATDQAMRVEVVGREEIEEKLLMTPGDIAMLLNETSGIRLQPTSPALGAAAVRVQGLPGRFTAVLTDGLPINGTQVASIGLLQIPPMDLQQVEVIKGAASAMYGPSALGGVINLVTRRPTPEHEGELLLNATTRSGGDAVVFAAGPASASAGYTLLAGLHGQRIDDVDGDGWADLPRYQRVIARPKVSWTAGATSLDATVGVTREDRRGGLFDSADGRQAVDTLRVDAGLAARRPVSTGVFVGKAAFVRLDHDHRYNTETFSDAHDALMLEGSYLWSRGRHTLVAGGGLDWQRYDGSRDDLNYSWVTPAVFVQDDVDVGDRMRMSLSARVDRHPEFGWLWSPRASVRWALDPWDVRVSAGRGAFAPTPFIDEVEEIGVHQVTHNRIDRAETAETVSVDVSREVGPVSVSLTGFGAAIHHPVRLSAVVDRGLRVAVFNEDRADSAIRILGAEAFARVRSGPWVATATHVWLRATELSEAGAREDVAYTPRRTFSLVAAWEQHGTARVGLEVYYTGRQALEENPYRTESAPYTIVGLLAERRFGRVRAFINLENLTDVRQSDYDPLLLPSATFLGKRAVSAWAPLEGRTINAGVRIGW